MKNRKQMKNGKQMKKVITAAAALVLLAGGSALSTGCSSGDAAGSNSGGSDGGGGSMARFTINGDFLYTVDDSFLKVLSVAEPSEPIESNEVYVGGRIETIFTMDDKLFIGSQGAMYIYDVSSPEFPEKLSMTNHLRSCDPVVAHDTLAFVTLNNSLGSWCGQTGDWLQSYDISDPTQPVLLDQVALSSPRGLAVDAEAGIVFVCDNGVKAYDISDPREITGLYTSNTLVDVKRITTYDCIVHDGRLLVIGSDGLYQFSYDRRGFGFISKIDLR